MSTNLPAATNTTALAEGLRDIVGPVRIIPMWQWVLAGLLVALAMAAALALYLGWQARRRRQIQPPASPPLLPAHLRARQQLELAFGLLGDPDRFCTELSRILRVYLEERFGWNAPDRTTEEFLFQLRGHAELEPGLRELLSDFLTRCDLVKFARHDPTEPELMELHRAAIRLVTDTIPAPPAPQPADPLRPLASHR
jgi:hypothetical protein